MALAWFLNRTRYGLAVRASADNPDAARLSGISVKAMSTMVWTLAGALATLTIVLAAPLEQRHRRQHGRRSAPASSSAR